MSKRIDRPEKERAALSKKIEADIRTLRRAGRIDRLHESHVASVAHYLSFYVEDQYSLAALELAAVDLVSTDSILTTPAPGSPEDIAEKAEAKTAAGPSRAEYARMSASARLEAINRQKLKELEASETQARRSEVEANAFDKDKPQTAAARLREANSFKEKAAREAKKAAPVDASELDANASGILTGTPAQKIGLVDAWKRMGIDLYENQLRKKSAGQRLGEANAAAYEAAKKKAKV